MIETDRLSLSLRTLVDATARSEQEWGQRGGLQALRPTSAESHTVESDTIPLLVSCQNDKSISELVRSDLEEVYNVGGGYLQCRLTASNVKRLGALPSVKYADILERNDLVMNNSAFEASGFVCGSDGQPIDLDLTGRNVLIGVIDTGIDLKHRCFYSQEGKLRIAGLLEQGHQKARVRDYTREELEHELAAGRYPGRDLHGHGTHVSSIAAGKGPHFRGIAPQAQFLIVQSNMIDTPYALEWIFSQADKIGWPCVVNCSYGHHYGAHDGTHIMERHIGGVVGPGRLVVAAAGNSGRSNVHASRQAHSLNDDFQLEFAVDESTRRFVLTAWYSQDDDFDVDLLHSQPVLSVPVSGEPAKYVRFGEVEATVVRGAYSLSGLTQLECCLDLPPSRGKDDLEGWALRFRPRRLNVGRVHAWIVHDDFGQFRDDSILSRESTLTIPGTSEHVITVGSYASTDHWQTDSGIGQDPDTEPGSISRFSSRGPRPAWSRPWSTHKPDLVAPGEWITAALSSTAPSRPSHDCQSKELRTSRGTSQSAPMISGLVALMLQTKKNLTASQTRAILQETATRDDWTGAGNDGWDPAYGFGKVNASAALARVREI